MVVKNYPILLLIFIGWACHLPGRNPDLEQLIGSYSGNDSFVKKKYLHDKPLAQLINMPVYTDLEMPFELRENDRVEVLAVGELIYNLADANPRYFFKGDDIELYFAAPSRPSTYIFSWADGMSHHGRIHFHKNGADFWGTQQIDSINSLYIAEIRFPWDSLDGIFPKERREIGFDLAVGNSDDGFAQQAKIAWNSRSDSMYWDVSGYGRLLLTGPADKPEHQGIIQSLYRTPQMDGEVDDLWKEVPIYTADHTVMGWIRHKHYLSATIRSCWDKKALYFLVEVQDVTRRPVLRKRIRETQTFADYGWIEDETGKKMWEMSALDSRPAGGAVKNQKIDTVIDLKKGKYILKYTSDESHTFNNWDDDPPATPFYGIILLKYHK